MFFYSAGSLFFILKSTSLSIIFCRISLVLVHQQSYCSPTWKCGYQFDVNWETHIWTLFRYRYIACDECSCFIDHISYYQFTSSMLKCEDYFRTSLANASAGLLVYNCLYGWIINRNAYFPTLYSYALRGSFA